MHNISDVFGAANSYQFGACCAFVPITGQSIIKDTHIYFIDTILLPDIVVQPLFTESKKLGIIWILGNCICSDYNMVENTEHNYSMVTWSPCQSMPYCYEKNCVSL